MGSSSNLERVLQEKYQRYLEVQRALEAYQLLYDTRKKQLEEIQGTINALEKLKAMDLDEFEGFLALGTGVFVFVRGTLKKQVLVSIASNIAVEMTIEDAIVHLNDILKGVTEDLSKINNAVQELLTTAQKLEVEIINMQKHLQKTK